MPQPVPQWYSLLSLSPPYSSLHPITHHSNTSVNPAAVSSSTYTDPSTTTLDSHDINPATLSICGGIAGAISKCQGPPASTSGTRFDLTTAAAGATVNVSRGQWEGCVRAARAVCGGSPFEAVCVGGASYGDVNFVLSANS